MPNACYFHPEQECDDPKKCRVHGPVLRRARKRTHELYPGLHSKWGMSKVDHLTLCGLFLHQIADFSKMTFAEQSAARDSFITHPRPPSYDPAYVVYYQAGYDRQEVLVATGVPTCSLCQKVKASL